MSVRPSAAGGNPLGWKRRGEDENVRRLRSLDDTVRSSIHLASETRRLEVRGAGDAARLSAAIRATASLVGTPVGASEAPERLGAAELALRAYVDQCAYGEGGPALGPMRVATYLSRILDASRPLTGVSSEAATRTFAPARRSNTPQSPPSGGR